MKLRVFQSTHPHGVRPTFVALSGNPGLFQSTHPHGVRLSSCCSDRFYSKFQSTHPHGVRRKPFSLRAWRRSFNPRTRMGCDATQQPEYRGVEVSIHAPAWGATYHVHYYRDSNQQFQSTHPHGVRPYTLYTKLPNRMFQSTHPHGVRPEPIIVFSVCTSFNPRTRMGCDQAHYDTMFLCVVSIHAPAWGATMCAYMHQEFEGFQSTHPHGVRLSQNAINQLSIQVSIHAPAWGATILAHFEVNISKFQSTHPHGVRLTSVTLPIYDESFNPRTRMGCDVISVSGNRP